METPNVVLVVLDCVRLKNLRWGDGPLKARTPNLDRLAREGIAFDHAIAPANWTVPSHASMLTGLYPHEHGVTSTRRGLSPSVPTLAQELTRLGYDTALFTEQSHLARSSALNAGYATVRATLPPLASAPSPVGANSAESASTRFAHSKVVRRLLDLVPVAGLPLAALIQLHRSRLKRQFSPDSLIRQAVEWVRTRRPDRPYHLLANFVDAHEPYAFGPMLDGGVGLRELIALLPAWYVLTVPGVRRIVSAAALERGYVAGIEAADRKLGQLVDAIDDSPGSDRTLIVVTSDHGQQFGEWGNFYHAGGVTDAVARVPLVVRSPRIDRSGVIDHRWTSVRQVHNWCLPNRGATVPAETEWPELNAPQLERADPVWCEGSPAWEVSSGFASAPREELWNRRLIASYLGDQKWVLDVATGRVWRSTERSLSWNEPALLCDVGAARWAVQSIFPPFAESSMDAVAGEAIDHPPALNPGQTLTSWGY
ncbi:MAG: sulfatase [Thermoplasmata archaeon]|nr:sulfatase [Thermoplasmata archaeon]